MDYSIIALLVFLTNPAYNAKECSAESDVEDPKASVETTTSNYNIDKIKELIQNKDVDNAALLISNISKQKSEAHNFNKEESSKIGQNKAYACSKLECSAEDTTVPVCACNFNTGNVASFRNRCDAKKHNCRFDTNFHVILEEICPWEFAFRRAKGFQFDYRDPKYYN